MKEHVAETMTSSKARVKYLWRNTLKKLGYSKRLAKHAEVKIKQKNSGKFELSTILEEIQRLEKELVQNSVIESKSLADNKDNGTDDDEDNDGCWRSFEEG